LVGATAVVSISALLAKVDFLAPLRWAGENSIVIYLAFFLPMALMRTAMLKLSVVSDIGTVSAVVTAAGVLGALAMWWAVRGSFARFLFERPERFWIAPGKRRVALQPAE
jgi:uncharacterized membrane protein YcfT